jgi:NAD(P)-dependent dehydrogenase (short-subunit alcohol dehydrogenase family)
MAAAELFDLTGRVALVTGASSGLGARFSQVLADSGASVVLVARRAERLAAVKARIEGAGGRALAVGADVLDRRAMMRAFDAAEAAFGCVTVLVNNAGVALRTARSIAGRRMAARHRHQSRCGLLWSQEGAPHARCSARLDRQHRVGARLRGVQRHHRLCRAGAGVNQVTKALGLELAFKGVRVNAIAPGWFVTDNREYLTSEEGCNQARDPGRPLRRGRRLDGALLLLA